MAYEGNWCAEKVLDLRGCTAPLDYLLYIFLYEKEPFLRISHCNQAF